MYASHAWVTHIGGEAHFTIFRAAKQLAKELVKMGQQSTRVRCQLARLPEAVGSGTYYWLELALLAGMFAINGAAPPPSKKLTEEGTLLTFVDSRQPLKYGSRLTCSPP